MHRLFALLTGVALSASASNAATQVIDSNGLLIGATGVVVGGATFDVSFLNGSCDSLFSGCDDGVIPFKTYADATLAAVALLDQVFPSGDFYALNPGQTVFCAPGTVACLSRISFADGTDGTDSHVVVQNGNNINELDDIFLDILPFDDDTTAVANANYASFTLASMPVPAAGWLLMAGLGGLFGVGRSRGTVR